MQFGYVKAHVDFIVFPNIPFDTGIRRPKREVWEKG